MSSRWVTRGYVAWTAAATVSTLGDGIIGFAVSWTATGINGTLAGMLSALGLVPTVVLLLVGGSLGDSLGQRRLLLSATLAQVGQYLVFWALLHTATPMVALLVGNAVVAGLLQGLRSPSTAVYARQFVAADDVKAAISVTSTLGSLTRMVNPTIGALVIAAAGLSGSVVADAVSFAGVLLVLVFITPMTTPAPAARVRMRGHITEGLASVWRDARARALLGSTALVAGALLPVVGIGIPLLVRSHDWSSTAAGALEGAWLAGSLAASIIITTRYARHPDASPRGIVIGPAMAAVGIVGLSLAASTRLALAACVCMGVGTSLFTANVSPVLVAITPPELQSRWAAVTTLAQFVPLIVINPTLGLASDHIGIRATLMALSVPAIVAAVIQARHRVRAHATA